ncbi:MAG: hypothetical protein HQ570_02245 [Candidatus Omnitrophica bacterium]|nr:hypothetical protein [Candidatus Omnitrophota bacterium]
MSKYYYLISELPFLKFNEKPFITKEFFLEEARKWLNEKDFHILKGVNIDDFKQGKEKDILGKYKKFEETLRQYIVSTRSRDQTTKHFSDVKAELLEGNPLKVEIKLFKKRWDFIESLELEHFFDIGFVILYFLKLQILDKLSVFNKEEGLTVFDSLCEVKV